MPNPNITRAFCSLVLLTVLANISAFAKTYYLSVKGNDAKTGASITQAWKSLYKLNTIQFSAGDYIIFVDAGTYPGTLVLKNISGEQNAPVTVTCLGDNAAQIGGGNFSGIVLENCSYIKISNLRIKGSGRKGGNKQGDGLSMSGCSHINVNNVISHGFQRTGIRIFNSAYIKLTYCKAYNNGFAGIFADDSIGKRNKYIYTGYCKAYGNAGDPTILHNHSGNGILYYQTDQSIIEYSEAYNNGYDQPKGPSNGPVGIWFASCDHDTIQRCISHNNQSTSGDGGGFDLDGGVTNCIIQYCYAYHNHSSGYLLWEYGSGIGVIGNTIRYCISENDGQGGIRLGQSGAGPIQNNRIYNNVFYNLHYPAVYVQSIGASSTKFYNNIFFCGKGIAILRDADSLIFKANCYWKTDGRFKIGSYTGFKHWAGTNMQEKQAGKLIGLNINPLINEPGKGKKLTDPFMLAGITTYRLKIRSPLKGMGLSLDTIAENHPPKENFYRQKINKKHPDIGID